jgi:cytochrome c-type biogenesis protein CcmF
VHINPLVNWLWLGFGILAMGTAIALLPERAVSFAAARLPAEAATASLLVLASLLAPAVARAQHVENPRGARLQVFPKEVRDATKKLACWCGGCSKLPVGECSCGHCALVKSEVTEMMRGGQTEEQVLQHFIEPGDHLNEGGHLGKSGLPLLSEPMSGSGRLVLYIPYLLGFVGALAPPGCLMTTRVSARVWTTSCGTSIEEFKVQGSKFKTGT